MRVLVAYAIAHGSTQQIAESVGTRLRPVGTEQMDVREPRMVGDPSPYDAFVVGSAVHDQGTASRGASLQ